MRTEIEYETYIKEGGKIEKKTIVYFDSELELIQYWESLGEFAEKVYGSMRRKSLVVKTEWVTLDQYKKDMLDWPHGYTEEEQREYEEEKFPLEDGDEEE